MKKGLLSELSAFSQLTIFFVLIIGSMLIFSLFGVIIAQFWTGIGFSSHLLSDFSNEASITYLKIMQLAQAFGLFIIPPIIAIFLFKKEATNYLYFNNTKGLWLLFSAIIMVVSLPIINSLALFNQNLSLPDSMSDVVNWMQSQEASAEVITKHFLKADTFTVLLLNLLIMAVLPAFGEEMLFRGVLQKMFSKMSKNSHIGIWLTAFIFSAIHMQFFTFLPRFFMGALFGYLLVWSGSIWLPIIAHFVNNGLAVIVSYLIQNKIVDQKIETVGNDNLSYLIVSVLLVSFLLIYLFKSTTKMRLKNAKIDYTE